MFERFTETARQVVTISQAEARKMKHAYIGTEHLLLGLLLTEDALAARVLASLDVFPEAIRDQIIKTVGEGETVVDGQIPFTSRAKKVLELALREALSLGHNYIGTEHVLLALARENEGVASRILADLEIDAEKIRSETMRALSGAGYKKRTVVPIPSLGGRIAYEIWVEALAGQITPPLAVPQGAPTAWQFVPEAEKRAWDAVAAKLDLADPRVHEYRLVT